MDSVPTIVASMLTSPLMGPILSLSLATNLQKWKLASLGLYTYVASMAISILVGFVVRYLRLCCMHRLSISVKHLSMDVLCVKIQTWRYVEITFT
jgi:hypothetical protein